jgi:hypothetical protein
MTRTRNASPAHFVAFASKATSHPALIPREVAERLGHAKPDVQKWRSPAAFRKRQRRRRARRRSRTVPPRARPSAQAVVPATGALDVVRHRRDARHRRLGTRGQHEPQQPTPPHPSRRNRTRARRRTPISARAAAGGIPPAPVAKRRFSATAPAVEERVGDAEQGREGDEHDADPLPTASAVVACVAPERRDGPAVEHR